MTRVQVLPEEAERERFRREAEREGLSLSAWLRRAGQDRLRSRQGRRLSTVRELREFFREVDAREKGREPDWDELVEARVGTIWSVEAEDVRLARALVRAHAGLGARDLLHLACCSRRGVDAVKTFDRTLAAAVRRR